MAKRERKLTENNFRMTKPMIRRWRTACWWYHSSSIAALPSRERECQWRRIFKVYYLNICDQISAFVFKLWTLILIQWNFRLNVDFGPKDDNGNMLQYFNISISFSSSLPSSPPSIFDYFIEWVTDWRLFTHTPGELARGWSDLEIISFHVLTNFDRFRFKHLL